MHTMWESYVAYFIWTLTYILQQYGNSIDYISYMEKLKRRAYLTRSFYSPFILQNVHVEQEVNALSWQWHISTKCSSLFERKGT